MINQHNFAPALFCGAAQTLLGWASDRLSGWLAMLAFLGISGTLMALMLYVARRSIDAGLTAFRHIAGTDLKPVRSWFAWVPHSASLRGDH
jgi:hypothetical protein